MEKRRKKQRGNFSDVLRFVVSDEWIKNDIIKVMSCAGNPKRFNALSISIDTSSWSIELLEALQTEIYAKYVDMFAVVVQFWYLILIEIFRCFFFVSSCITSTSEFLMHILSHHELYSENIGHLNFKYGKPLRFIFGRKQKHKTLRVGTLLKGLMTSSVLKINWKASRKHLDWCWVQRVSYFYL